MHWVLMKWGFSTLETIYSVNDFRCGHISFAKGEFTEECFLVNVNSAMFGLGVTMTELVPENVKRNARLSIHLSFFVLFMHVHKIQN